MSQEIIPNTTNNRGNEQVDMNSIGGMSTNMTSNQLKQLKEAAKDYVRNFLFSKKQFVKDEDMRFGNPIQKLTCANLKITDESEAETFWDYEGGQEIVRTAIRQKRQVYMNSVGRNVKRKC